MNGRANSLTDDAKSISLRLWPEDNNIIDDDLSLASYVKAIFFF